MIALHGLAASGAVWAQPRYVIALRFHGGIPGCSLDLTHDREAAKVFATWKDCFEYWRQIHPRMPRRPDGQPNRPLTAYHASFVPLAVPG